MRLKILHGVAIRGKKEQKTRMTAPRMARPRCQHPSKPAWPWHGWLGLILIAVFWTLNWSLTGLRTHWAFFPLWTGYSLTVDALAYWRQGSSLLTRNARSYIGLFLVSAPGWWLFESLNLRTQNWLYPGAEYFSNTTYFLLCTLSFSTVMPAVFGTAEWIGSFGRLERLQFAKRFRLTGILLSVLFLTGWVLLAALLLWPRYCFPLMWGAVYLIVDPLNVWLGNPSLLSQVARGHWRPVVALSLGCLVCGFFWEMWNVYSYPKWTYDVPFVDFARLFEMPLLGYLGYPVFAWELFALYHFLMGLFGKKESLFSFDSRSVKTELQQVETQRV